MTPSTRQRRGRRKPKPSLRILITAGPTREYVDPVRYLSNESSGKMGFALAERAARAGHEVTLVAGPVHQPTPSGVERIDVVSARDMYRAARDAFREAQALFMCAAVADWRPARKRVGKWRKKEQGSEVASLELVRNTDILASLGRRKGSRLVVGFALETGNGVTRALEKMRRKNADYIVLNDETALGADRSSVTILGRDGQRRSLENRSKAVLASALVRLAEKHFA